MTQQEEVFWRPAHGQSNMNIVNPRPGLIGRGDPSCYSMAMPFSRLGKTGFRFNALHSFPADDGYDRLPHGHDYEFTVLLEGEHENQGMLFDLRQLKPLVEREVVARLDHTDLDQLLPEPSLEALAEWIWRQLRPHLPARLRLGLVVWETRSLFVEFWGD